MGSGEGLDLAHPSRLYRGNSCGQIRPSSSVVDVHVVTVQAVSHFWSLSVLTACYFHLLAVVKWALLPRRQEACWCAET